MKEEAGGRRKTVACRDRNRFADHIVHDAKGLRVRKDYEHKRAVETILYFEEEFVPVAGEGLGRGRSRSSRRLA